MYVCFDFAKPYQYHYFVVLVYIINYFPYLGVLYAIIYSPLNTKHDSIKHMIYIPTNTDQTNVSIVYIQNHLGWKVGFGVWVALMFLSTIFFFLTLSMYIKHNPNKSLFIGLVQVGVVVYKNRKLPLPPLSSESLYHHKKDLDLVAPTNKLR